MSFSFRKRNLSAFANFLRAKYDMHTGAVRVGSRPYYLCLDPSDICQLRCPTCPTGIENELRRKKGSLEIYRSDRQKLSTELANAVLDELGDYLFLVMFYNYGEPLLNPRLPDLVAAATARDIATEVHTNLSVRLSDEQIDALLGSGLDALSASVDGFSQEAYEVHRVGGDIELVKRNLERLSNARQRLGLATQISYRFLVFRHNEHEVDAARRFASDLGITFATSDAFIHDPTWLPSHRAGEQPYYSAAEFAALRERWQRDGHGDYFFQHENHPFWSPLPKTPDPGLPAACSWHYGYSVITSGGPVAPCCAVAKDRDDFGKVVPGSVAFADVWNGDRYVSSRAALAGRAEAAAGVDTVCARCYFPKLIHHLYSIYDARVLARFREVFGTTEPAMAKGLELVGCGERPADVQSFLEHFERHVGAQALASV
jgi:MoaA/NifB/PqqE/SkfB family radical SAM enzyme